MLRTPIPAIAELVVVELDFWPTDEPVRLGGTRTVPGCRATGRVLLRAGFAVGNGLAAMGLNPIVITRKAVS